MPISSHLLERAYQLINANQFQNAELVLDAVVRVEPKNVDAWKTYLQIHQSQNDLDWLIERVLKTSELSESEKSELHDFYNILTKQQNGVITGHFQIGASDILLQKKVESPTSENVPMMRFELLDVFDYPIKNIIKDPRPKVRQRAVYNTIFIDIAKGILKTLSRNSSWKQTVIYLEKSGEVASRFVNNPKESFTSYINSPSSKVPLGISMLAVFVIGVRLFLLGYLLGYVFLGMFVVANVWWLINFGHSNVNQSHRYFYKDAESLPEVDVTEDAESYELDEDDFWKVEP